jgi:hypothetical protein
LVGDGAKADRDDLATARGGESAYKRQVTSANVDHYYLCDGGLRKAGEERTSGDAHEGREFIKCNDNGDEKEQEDVCNALESFRECVDEFSAGE